MALFKAQVAASHVGSSDHCPWCEQPVPNDKFQELSIRYATREREQKDALERGLRDSLAAEHARAIDKLTREAAAKEAALRDQVRAAAEAEVQKRVAAIEKHNASVLTELQAKLEQSETARETAAAAAKSQQENFQAMLMAKLQDVREASEKEKIAAVLAEKSKAFEERQKIENQVLNLQRQLENKTAQEIGEGAEIDLFEALKAEFPEDRLRRVEKGAAGADIVHEVYHNGKFCGRLIYDSKKHNAWRNDFVTKLRSDQAAAKADHAILSSHIFPSGARQLHLQDGVIVTHPARVVALVQLLRRHVVQTYALRLSNEARTQKTAALYEFIMSERCTHLLGSLETHASDMIELDSKEQRAHQATWKKRNELIRAVQRAHSDLTSEIEHIIGTAPATPNMATEDEF